MKTKKLIEKYENENKDLFSKIRCKENSMQEKSRILYLIERNSKFIRYLEPQVLYEEIQKSNRNMILFFCLAGLAGLAYIVRFILLCIV